MNLEWKIRLGLVGVIVVLLGVIFYLNRRHDAQIEAANNQLANLIPLQHVNDSLAYRVAKMVSPEEAQRLMDEKSQLRKTIQAKNEQILFLASTAMEARAESVYVPVYKRVGKTFWFAKEDDWFSISGRADTSQVFLETIQTRDSITVAITRSEQGLLFGYLQNHSPYNRILNGDFAVAWQPDKPWFRFDGFGVIGGARFPGNGYVGIDIKACLWDRFELSPRFTTEGKSIEGRWKLPIFGSGLL